MTWRLALVVIAAGALVACSGTPKQQEPEAAPAAGVEPSPAAGVEPAAPGASPEPTPLGDIPEADVLIYFPSQSSTSLVGETRRIFLTNAPGDRAKQIVADLIAGPSSSGSLPAVPEGTSLRQLYVLKDGTAYADFSGELAQGVAGSSGELMTVYAIVDSILANVSEIHRVGILIDGKRVDTISGHLDLRRPLAIDRAWISGASSAPAAPPS